MTLTIRERHPDDLPALTELLGAWVAEVDGVVAGHVAATDPTDNWMADEWRRVTGRPGDELGEVSVLFVGLDHGGAGVGGALLDHAVAEIRALGRDPVLDVIDEDSSAGRFYVKRGWRTVGYGRPPWLEEHLAPVAYMTLGT